MKKSEIVVNRDRLKSSILKVAKKRSVFVEFLLGVLKENSKLFDDRRFLLTELNHRSLCFLDCSPVEGLLSDEKRCLDLSHHWDSKVEEHHEEESDHDSHETVWLQVISNVLIAKKKVDIWLCLCDWCEGRCKHESHDRVWFHFSLIQSK